jgi:hypothetical protein
MLLLVESMTGGMLSSFARMALTSLARLKPVFPT